MAYEISKGLAYIITIYSITLLVPNHLIRLLYDFYFIFRRRYIVGLSL